MCWAILTVLLIQGVIVLAHFLVEFFICKVIRSPCILDHGGNCVSNHSLHRVEIMKNESSHFFQILLLHLDS